MGIIYCITIIVATAIVCDCIKQIHKSDNDNERLERENRELWRRLDKKQDEI